MRRTSPAELNDRSREVRQARKHVRRALATGQLTITDAMRGQPAELADRALFEVLLMARNVGRRRLHELNERAVDDNVNLAITLEHADERTREWIAAHALRASSPASVWERLMEEA